MAAFYLDHNVARELADHLRAFGHVAHTAHEGGWIAPHLRGKCARPWLSRLGLPERGLSALLQILLLTDKSDLRLLRTLSVVGAHLGLR